MSDDRTWQVVWNDDTNFGRPPVTPPQPTNNFTDYRAAVSEALAQSPQEWTFKSDPRYRRILEHVTAEQAVEFARVAEDACLPSRWPAVYNLFPRISEESDSLGRPPVERIPRLGVSCSPTNLRYLCHAVMIWEHLERLKLKDVHIVEVGGGYGGLALYVHRLASLFPTRLRSYTVIDLPEVKTLVAQYTQALGLRVRVKNGLSAGEIEDAFFPDDGLPRYFVSCYAFSEFDAETRAWYEERVARRCAHGFLVWNFMQPLVGVAEKPLGGPLYPFVDAPLETEPERPNSGPGNLVVRF